MDLNALGMGQGVAQFEQRDIGVLCDQFDEEGLVGLQLTPPCGTSAFDGSEAFPTSDLEGKPRARRRGDHQALGRFARTQALFNETLETTPQVKRKGSWHGKILLDGRNHKKHPKQSQTIQRSNKLL